MVSRLAIVLLALVASVVGRPAPAPASAPQAEPQWQSHSYYIASPSMDAIRNLGCSNGHTQGRSTLFFGAPTQVGGTVGTTLWSGADQTVDQIGELVKEYVRGYVACRHSSSHQAFIAMGTSTSAIDGKADGWLTVHGRHWAEVTSRVNHWATQHHPGAVRIYGGWDPEPSWSSPHKAEQWMHGYATHPTRRGLHVHASADGCPRDHANNGGCNNGWNQHTLWRLAWEYDPALPMPQIYATSGVNARQWQKIDEYGAVHRGDGMVFYGTMSQHGACLQVGGCRGTDNTSIQAHDFLLFYLNSHPATAQPSIETATDIGWHR